MNDQKEGKEKLEISVKKANEKQKEKLKTKSLTSKTSGKSLNDMVQEKIKKTEGSTEAQSEISQVSRITQRKGTTTIVTTQRGSINQRINSEHKLPPLQPNQLPGGGYSPAGLLRAKEKYVQEQKQYQQKLKERQLKKDRQQQEKKQMDEQIKQLNSPLKQEQIGEQQQDIQEVKVQDEPLLQQELGQINELDTQQSHSDRSYTISKSPEATPPQSQRNEEYQVQQRVQESRNDNSPRPQFNENLPTINEKSESQQYTSPKFESQDIKNLEEIQTSKFQVDLEFNQVQVESKVTQVQIIKQSVIKQSSQKQIVTIQNSNESEIISNTQNIVTGLIQQYTTKAIGQQQQDVQYIQGEENIILLKTQITTVNINENKIVNRDVIQSIIQNQDGQIQQIFESAQQLTRSQSQQQDAPQFQSELVYNKEQIEEQLNQQQQIAGEQDTNNKQTYNEEELGNPFGSQEEQYRKQILLSKKEFLQNQIDNQSINVEGEQDKLENQENLTTQKVEQQTEEQSHDQISNIDVLGNPLGESQSIQIQKIEDESNQDDQQQDSNKQGNDDSKQGSIQGPQGQGDQSIQQQNISQQEKQKRQQDEESENEEEDNQQQKTQIQDDDELGNPLGDKSEEEIIQITQIKQAIKQQEKQQDNFQEDIVEKDKNDQIQNEQDLERSQKSQKQQINNQDQNENEPDFDKQKQNQIQLNIQQEQFRNQNKNQINDQQQDTDKYINDDSNKGPIKDQQGQGENSRQSQNISQQEINIKQQDQESENVEENNKQKPQIYDDDDLGNPLGDRSEEEISQITEIKKAIKQQEKKSQTSNTQEYTDNIDQKDQISNIQKQNEQQFESSQIQLNQQKSNQDDEKDKQINDENQRVQQDDEEQLGDPFGKLDSNKKNLIQSNKQEYLRNLNKIQSDQQQDTNKQGDNNYQGQNSDQQEKRDSTGQGQNYSQKNEDIPSLNQQQQNEKQDNSDQKKSDIQDEEDLGNPLGNKNEEELKQVQDNKKIKVVETETKYGNPLSDSDQSLSNDDIKEQENYISYDRQQSSPKGSRMVDSVQRDEQKQFNQNQQTIQIIRSNTDQDQISVNLIRTYSVGGDHQREIQSPEDQISLQNIHQQQNLLQSTEIQNDIKIQQEIEIENINQQPIIIQDHQIQILEQEIQQFNVQIEQDSQLQFILNVNKLDKSALEQLFKNSTDLEQKAVIKHLIKLNQEKEDEAINFIKSDINFRNEYDDHFKNQIVILLENLDDILNTELNDLSQESLDDVYGRITLRQTQKFIQRIPFMVKEKIDQYKHKLQQEIEDIENINEDILNDPIIKQISDKIQQYQLKQQEDKLVIQSLYQDKIRQEQLIKQLQNEGKNIPPQHQNIQQQGLTQINDLKINLLFELNKETQYDNQSFKEFLDNFNVFRVNQYQKFEIQQDYSLNQLIQQYQNKDKQLQFIYTQLSQLNLINNFITVDEDNVTEYFRILQQLKEYLISQEQEDDPNTSLQEIIKRRELRKLQQQQQIDNQKVLSSLFEYITSAQILKNYQFVDINNYEEFFNSLQNYRQLILEQYNRIKIEKSLQQLEEEQMQQQDRNDQQISMEKCFQDLQQNYQDIKDEYQQISIDFQTLTIEHQQQQNRIKDVFEDIIRDYQENNQQRYIYLRQDYLQSFVDKFHDSMIEFFKNQQTNPEQIQNIQNILLQIRQHQQEVIDIFTIDDEFKTNNEGLKQFIEAFNIKRQQKLLLIDQNIVNYNLDQAFEQIYQERKILQDKINAFKKTIDQNPNQYLPSPKKPQKQEFNQQQQEDQNQTEEQRLNAQLKSQLEAYEKQNIAIANKINQFNKIMGQNDSDINEIEKDKEEICYMMNTQDNISFQEFLKLVKHEIKQSRQNQQRQIIKPPQSQENQQQEEQSVTNYDMLLSQLQKIIFGEDSNEKNINLIEKEIQVIREMLNIQEKCSLQNTVHQFLQNVQQFSNQVKQNNYEKDQSQQEQNQIVDEQTPQSQSENLQDQDIQDINKKASINQMEEETQQISSKELKDQIKQLQQEVKKLKFYITLLQNQRDVQKEDDIESLLPPQPNDQVVYPKQEKQQENQNIQQQQDVTPTPLPLEYNNQDLQIHDLQQEIIRLEEENNNLRLQLQLKTLESQNMEYTMLKIKIQENEQIIEDLNKELHQIQQDKLLQEQNLAQLQLQINKIQQELQNALNQMLTESEASKKIIDELNLQISKLQEQQQSVQDKNQIKKDIEEYCANLFQGDNTDNNQEYSKNQTIQLIQESFNRHYSQKLNQGNIQGEIKINQLIEQYQNLSEIINVIFKKLTFINIIEEYQEININNIQQYLLSVVQYRTSINSQISLKQLLIDKDIQNQKQEEIIQQQKLQIEDQKNKIDQLYEEKQKLNEINHELNQQLGTFTQNLDQQDNDLKEYKQKYDDISEQNTNRVVSDHILDEYNDQTLIDKVIQDLEKINYFDLTINNEDQYKKFIDGFLTQKLNMFKKYNIDEKLSLNQVLQKLQQVQDNPMLNQLRGISYFNDVNIDNFQEKIRQFIAEEKTIEVISLKVRDWPNLHKEILNDIKSLKDINLMSALSYLTQELDKNRQDPKERFDQASFQILYDQIQKMEQDMQQITKKEMVQQPLDSAQYLKPGINPKYYIIENLRQGFYMLKDKATKRLQSYQLDHIDSFESLIDLLVDKLLMHQDQSQQLREQFKSERSNIHKQVNEDHLNSLFEMRELREFLLYNYKSNNQLLLSKGLEKLQDLINQYLNQQAARLQDLEFVEQQQNNENQQVIIDEIEEIQQENQILEPYDQLEKVINSLKQQQQNLIEDYIQMKELNHIQQFKSTFFIDVYKTLEEYIIHQIEQRQNIQYINIEEVKQIEEQYQGQIQQLQQIINSQEDNFNHILNINVENIVWNINDIPNEDKYYFQYNKVYAHFRNIYMNILEFHENEINKVNVVILDDYIQNENQLIYAVIKKLQISQDVLKQQIATDYYNLLDNLDPFEENLDQDPLKIKLQEVLKKYRKEYDLKCIGLREFQLWQQKIQIQDFKNGLYQFQEQDIHKKRYIQIIENLLAQYDKEIIEWLKQLQFSQGEVNQHRDIHKEFMDKFNQYYFARISSQDKVPIIKKNKDGVEIETLVPVRYLQTSDYSFRMKSVIELAQQLGQDIVSCFTALYNNLKKIMKNSQFQEEIVQNEEQLKRIINLFQQKQEEIYEIMKQDQRFEQQFCVVENLLQLNSVSVLKLHQKVDKYIQFVAASSQELYKLNPLTREGALYII